ncbi:MAG: hypothetical protein IJ753_04830 [Bacteroidales bacterium]|nr:hypothetical protein [Bacteroidales bacterium]MBQ9194217.1 hypothetical protein [Bacteroidales bacterium]MBQ9702458.1 hypothetical protein [Bacteroidales bacterium]MBR0245136.1 hypothetical protein [Bacteroidales bacterium]MBR1782825.1 hypothetical protein [Bacteroidales bacterium]
MTPGEYRRYSEKLQKAGFSDARQREVMLEFLDRLSKVLVKDYLQKHADYEQEKKNRRKARNGQDQSAR